MALAIGVAILADCPALHATRANVNEMLKEGAAAEVRALIPRLRGLLVTSEVALR